MLHARVHRQFDKLPAGYLPFQQCNLSRNNGIRASGTASTGKKGESYARKAEAIGESIKEA